MHCEQAQPQLAAFLLGELSEQEANRIAAHIPECERCRLELESLRATTNALFRFGETELALVAGEGEAAELAEAAYRKRRANRSLPALRLRRLAPGLLALAGAALLIAVRAPRPTPSQPHPLAMAPSQAARAAPSQAAPAAPDNDSAQIAGPRLVEATASSSRTIGTVVAVKGDPRIKPPGSGWGVCREAQPVVDGAAVRTGDTGTVDIELTDGSRVNLDFNTVAEFRPAADADKPSRPASVSLSEGRAWLLVSPAQAGLTVSTPAARATALGTLFSVSVSPESEAPEPGKGPRPEPTPRTSLTVVHGEVQFANQWGLVVAGRESYSEATAGHPPSPPRGLQHLRTVLLRTPWGQTTFEIWVADRLRQEEALRRLAGTRAWLGLIATPGSSEVGQNAAPFVTTVLPGSPAAQAGILPGDRLLRVGKIAVNSPVDLARAELLLTAGDPTEVVGEREGRSLEARLTPVVRREGGAEAEMEQLAAGNRALALDRPMEAEQHYRAAIKEHGEEAAAWNNLGLVTQLVSTPDQALPSLREAVRLDPTAALYHFNLGLCYAGIGNLERSRAELAAAVEADQQFPGGRAMLGRVEALAGYSEAAKQQAEALMASPETHPQGLFLTGEILRIGGDADASEQWYLKAAEEDRYYVEPPTALGAVYYNQGKLQEAKRWLAKALALDPLSLRALNRMGLVLTKTEELDGAEAALKKAARFYPDSGIVYSNLGRVYLKRSELGPARSAFRRGLELDPNSTLSHELMAIGMEAGSQFDGAKREYELAIRLDPSYLEGYERLASLHRQLGERRLADAVLARARRFGL